VIDDARQIPALPASARQRFWDLLGPSLAEPVPRDAEARFDAFAEAHGAAPEALARSLRLARVLVRQASVLDVDAAQLTEDLMKLGGGDPALAHAIMPGFERAKRVLRAELAHRAIADHGKVLEEVRWRVDLLSTSDRGLALKLPVLMMTLCYRDGDRTERLSVQVLPHIVAQLRAICDHVLGKR
jgi:hypothetical protein